MFSLNSFRASTTMKLQYCHVMPLFTNTTQFTLLRAFSIKHGQDGGGFGPVPKYDGAMKHKDGKFSAFLKSGEKDYFIKDEWKNFVKAAPVQRFDVKEEFSRIPFDPSIRHRLPSIPNSLVYRALGEIPWDPQFEPQSMYVSQTNKDGKTVHLFNAARFPLGRMAVLIAKFIRGTHKPGYDPARYDQGDICVVVNAANTKVTGRKRF